MTSIKFNGREIQNPVIKVLVVVALAMCCAIAVVFGSVMIPVILGLIVLALVLTIPLHLILRICGRRGFYVRDGNKHTWTNTGAFQRR